MQVPGLNTEEQESLLRGNWVAKLATYCKNGSIRITPLNYAVEDDTIHFSTWAASAATANLQNDTRASVLIDDPNPPYKGVHYVGEAKVQAEAASPDELAERFGRYSASPEEAAQFYSFIPSIGKRVRITFHPNETVTWDLSKI